MCPSVCHMLAYLPPLLSFFLMGVYKKQKMKNEEIVMCLLVVGIVLLLVCFWGKREGYGYDPSEASDQCMQECKALPDPSPECLGRCDTAYQYQKCVRGCGVDTQCISNCQYDIDLCYLVECPDFGI